MLSKPPSVGLLLQPPVKTDTGRWLDRSRAPSENMFAECRLTLSLENLLP